MPACTDRLFIPLKVTFVEGSRRDNAHPAISSYWMIQTNSNLQQTTPASSLCAQFASLSVTCVHSCDSQSRCTYIHSNFFLSCCSVNLYCVFVSVTGDVVHQNRNVVVDRTISAARDCHHCCTEAELPTHDCCIEHVPFVVTDGAPQSIYRKKVTGMLETFQLMSFILML